MPITKDDYLGGHVHTQNNCLLIYSFEYLSTLNTEADPRALCQRIIKENKNKIRVSQFHKIKQG